MSDYLLTASEVAKTLRISKSFAYQLMTQGEIPTIRVGRCIRVRPGDLEKFLDSRAQNVHNDLDVAKLVLPALEDGDSE